MMYISETPEEGVRLVGWTASVKSAQTRLKIEIEITDPLKLGYYLKDLETLLAAQKRKPKARPMLALPAPGGSA